MAYIFNLILNQRSVSRECLPKEIYSYYQIDDVIMDDESINQISSVDYESNKIKESCINVKMIPIKNENS